MKNSIQLQSILFFCVFIVSCQKGFKNPLAHSETPVTPHDSVMRLSKLIFFYPTFSGNDTLSYYEYFYDSLQRVSTININVKGVSSLYSVITYYYTGSDSVAYKKTSVYTDSLYNSDSASYFYFYDNYQRLIKDSIILSYAVEVDQYKYSNTMITAMKQGVDTAGLNNPYWEADTGFIGPSGDVIKTNSFTNSYVSYITSFTYDDKTNPFIQLNIRTTYKPVPGFNFYLEDFYLQKNNAVFINQDIPGYPGSTATSMYNYTYNTFGFPDSVNIINHLGTRSNSSIKFVYKKI